MTTEATILKKGKFIYQFFIQVFLTIKTFPYKCFFLRGHKSFNQSNCPLIAIPSVSLVYLSFDFKKGTIIKEANQSSTNGSFEALLAFDGDMDTFSMTNDGSNQWWSATLVKRYEIAWVFVRIKTGIYLQIHHYII